MTSGIRRCPFDGQANLGDPKKCSSSVFSSLESFDSGRKSIPAAVMGPSTVQSMEQLPDQYLRSEK